MSEHIETRRKLKSIPRVDTFTELLDVCTLDEFDKQVMNLHYLKGKDFAYIGDELGFSESTIKSRHSKILKKIGKVI